MEMSLNNGFKELSEDEMLLLDGGASEGKIALVAGIGVLAIAFAPAVGVGAVVVGGATVAVGAGTALGLVGGGCLAIGSASHAM
mgnify:FL=1